MKLALFNCDMLAQLTWGAESWCMIDSVQHTVSRWASRCLSLITGKSQQEEASHSTQTMGVVGILDSQRLRLLGHELRADPGLLER